MNPPGDPFGRGKVQGGPPTAYSPLSRPAYNQGSFERVLESVEVVEPPKRATPTAEINPTRDESTDHRNDVQSDEEKSRVADADQRFAEMSNWPSVESGRNAGPTSAPIAQQFDPPSLPPDAETLAAKLDQMGIRLSVRGLSVGSAVPLAASSPVAAYAPAAAPAKTELETAEGAAAEANQATAGDSTESIDTGTNSEGAQSNSQQSDTPGEQAGGSFAAQLGSQLGTAAFATLSEEAVAAVDAAGAIESLQPVHIPDGITVRVVDPDGAWEVDVMRTGTDLALILRGSQEITDSVLRDESTLRNDLAREGWRLSHLRVDPTNETPQAVRATSGSESTQTSTNMQSDHSEAGQQQAKREEAPAWQNPRTMRPAPRAVGTPTISATGRLDREI